MIIVKFGGSILGGGVSPSIVQDIKMVAEKEKLVLIHGGGDEVTEVASKLGKEQKFIVSPEGIRSRYTDKETASIYTMVMAGKISKEVVAALQGIGLQAVGFSGIDGGLIKATRKEKLIVVDERGRKRIIDGGYTGKIQEVNTQLLNILLSNGYLPVISPIAIGRESEMLNVDGDRAASHVAGALKADILIFLTDVEGVILEGKLCSKLKVEEARQLMPKIGFGMVTKILASIEALEMGVGRVVIAPGLRESPLASALEGSSGTVITK